MKVLVDTNALIIFLAEANQLRPDANDLLTDDRNELFLSVAAVWEVGTLTALNRNPLPRPFEEYIERLFVTMRLRILEIAYRHALAVGSLPMHHRDPFDRIMIAQAKVDAMTIITSDRVLERYDVPIVRAR